MNINWKILSKDATTNSMVVEYSGEGTAAVALNIPMPPTSASPDDWVKQYLPSSMVEPLEYHDLEVGHESTFEVSAGALTAVEQPSVIGSWSEEYIRALIYTVLEEIKDSAA